MAEAKHCNLPSTTYLNSPSFDSIEYTNRKHHDFSGRLDRNARALLLGTRQIMFSDVGTAYL